MVKLIPILLNCPTDRRCPCHCPTHYPARLHITGRLIILAIIDCFYKYTLPELCRSKPPLPTGAYYFFNDTLQYLAPSPPPPQILSRFPAKINLIYFHPQRSKIPAFLNSKDTNISPAQLPNTSLPIPITDAIGSSKYHCCLVPIIRDLIEA